MISRAACFRMTKCWPSIRIRWVTRPRAWRSKVRWKAVGLFNRGDDETQVTVKWSELGITGKQTVRDLWRQKDLGKFEGEFTTTVPRHGVVLVKIGPGV